VKTINLLANTGSMLAPVTTVSLSNDTLDYITAKGWQLPLEEGQNALYVAVRVSELLGLATQDVSYEAARLAATFSRTDEVDRRELDPARVQYAASAASEIARLLEQLDRHHATVLQNVERVD
jgi:hypothetical protein